MIPPALLEADAKDEQSIVRATQTPPCAFVYSVRSPQINCRYVLKINAFKSFTASREPSSAETVSLIQSYLIHEVLY